MAGSPSPCLSSTVPGRAGSAGASPIAPVGAGASHGSDDVDAAEVRAGRAVPGDLDAVGLRDGSVVGLRPATVEDEEALLAFLDRLCVNSRRMRFFTGAADLRGAAHWAATGSGDGGGIVALDDAGELVGHAAYALLDERSAEVAVEVADRLHGNGLGTILIERLAEQAESRGVERFVAEVLPENRQMLAVFRDGFDAKVTFDRGTEAVEFPTASWRLARERFG